MSDAFEPPEDEPITCDSCDARLVPGDVHDGPDGANLCGECAAQLTGDEIGGDILDPEDDEDEEEEDVETAKHVWTCPDHGEQRGPCCMACGAACGTP